MKQFQYQMMLDRSERRNEHEEREIMLSEGLDHFPKNLVIPMTVDGSKQAVDTNEV